MLSPILAQASPTPEEMSGDFVWAVGLVVVIAAVLCLPFFLWRATRRWSFAIFLLLCASQAALLYDSGALQFYSLVGGILVPGLLLPAVLYIPLLWWRRTRRFALVFLGLTVVSGLALMNHWGLVISSIGWVLFLLALWPCWRLLQAAPRGREVAPVVPSRGVLQVRSWPSDGRSGFTLVSAVVGVACLTVAFALGAMLIAGTTSAIHRADRLAVATDLLESARERALLGAEAGDLAAHAGAALPHGQASLQRTPAGTGLVRVTATATWREPDGKPGRTTLEWLALERAR